MAACGLYLPCLVVVVEVAITITITVDRWTTPKYTNGKVSYANSDQEMVDKRGLLNVTMDINSKNTSRGDRAKDC